VKKTDIKPGVIYAWKRSKHYSPTQVMFLTPLNDDCLYTSERGKGIVRARRSYTKPKAYYSYGSADVGWLVAMGSDVAGASLQDALDSGHRDPATFHDLHYQALVSLAQVVGVYDEVAAAEEAEKNRLADIRAAEKAKCEAASSRWVSLSSSLSELGVQHRLVGSSGEWTDSEYSRAHNPPRSIQLNYDQAVALNTRLSERG
jgi:hypothetical protein